MDSEQQTQTNKENSDPNTINELNFSVDSLEGAIDPAPVNETKEESPLVDVSIGPALTVASSVSFNSPALITQLSNEDDNPKPFAECGDSNDSNTPTTLGNSANLTSLLVEAEQYADDLAREVINETNQLVVNSQAAEEVKPLEAEVVSAEGSKSKVAEIVSVAESKPAEEEIVSRGESEPVEAEIVSTKESEPEQADASFVEKGKTEKAETVPIEGSQDEEVKTSVEEGELQDIETVPVKEVKPLETEVDFAEGDKPKEETVPAEKSQPEEVEIVSSVEESRPEEEQIVSVEESKTEEAKIVSTEQSQPEEAEIFPVKEGEPEETEVVSVEEGGEKITTNPSADDSTAMEETQWGCASLLEESDKSTEMEFTKNYSDDLLMGQTDGAHGGLPSGGPDLADFELPPYSGSSSGSEPRPSSPIKHNFKLSTSSSSAAAAQESNSQQVNTTNVAPPDLSAVKNLLFSGYSKVSHIFHWTKPIESGIFFTIGAGLIIALTFFSIISVVAYTALGIILTSCSIRTHKSLMKALNRSTETPVDHIWDKVLSLNVSLSSEKVYELVDASLANLNASLGYLKQVLLAEDKLATFKLGLVLYLLTYIGSWFNGMTLITISYLALFTVPILYEKNKAKIDEIIALTVGQASSTLSTVTNKVTSMVFGSAAPLASGSKKQN